MALRPTHDLLDYAAQKRKFAPLADRMRPQTLDQFIGQEQILGPGRLLRRAILADQLSSLIFYGPPGTGKTTLARIIANHSKSEFLAINAVLAGIKEIREAISEAEVLQREQGRRSILFVDEVHRFNKAQQDALLPHVERGLLILIGATTENPYFEVNKALVSRSRIFELKSLETQDIRKVLVQALKNEDQGYGKLPLTVTDEALDHLAEVASGDARAALNALELAVISSDPGPQGEIVIDLLVAEDSIQRRAVLYDKDGDVHFDVASAFIKSMRGSDPDAALYWMARMIYGGEDPKFLFRRMIIFASEDIGLADPKALEQVIAAARAYDYVGMPEGRFHLSQACLYLSTAPKSNSGFAFFDALKTVETERPGEIPNSLKDGNRDQEGFGHGKGYLYPHAYQDHWVNQQYLPQGLSGKLFYQPGSLGFEAALKEGVEKRREAQLAAMLEAERGGQAAWEERSLGGGGELLGQVRDQLFLLAQLGAEPLVLCLEESSGLLLGQAIRQAPKGSFCAQTNRPEQAEMLKAQFHRGKPSDPVIETGSLLEVADRLFKAGVRFDWIIGMETQTEFFSALLSLLAPRGSLLLAKRIPAQGQRLGAYLSEHFRQSPLGQKFLALEEALFTDANNPKFVERGPDLKKHLEQLGLVQVQLAEQTLSYPVRFTPGQIGAWLDPQRPFGYGSRMAEWETGERETLLKELSLGTGKQKLPFKSAWAFLKAQAP
ncbi:MAG: hypothetical protein A2600_04625 [Candidatus Lambdaproteobacteria bacterium RIFOXYD1_FULL_56_27]|uniref:Replication-associated recombination protein A n=1 Tax=Candidatus Lambdaproteobacteria bacterium RIFOXYD2_FULL_56_26 TaxID=1817773 RepID=A0A1F6H3T8_9PROT|nr:MAG: hypothetical protein A2426_13690 [Candidatus Lambdaproteobacteria bacterium RIFOXYC1_FULL_56_13]OGH05039.1 MAG: hypothetical protein A2557_08690 [Candidatus Lambdaproteobacteria bacterium RIFOXYD2_FULL_56_26]OGH09504.1 MAG: hypothetical protein A2600_04625 [Candidatus Lambdaproteobacteria bacterium RIFOXYD1_FULL_56_27]